MFEACAHGAARFVIGRRTSGYNRPCVPKDSLNRRRPRSCGSSSVKNSMTNAAAKIGMKRITHHDLRHLFATICSESGVDIPTVSRWLGHKDGGAFVYANGWPPAR